MAKKKEVVPVENNALFGDFINNDGAGFENVSSSDLALPFISILQPMSKQVLEETGKAGEFWHSVRRKSLGNKIKVIPVGFKKLFIEWKSREDEGGFVKYHFDESILEKAPVNEKYQNVLPNGNLIVTTAYHFALLLTDDIPEPVIITMSSTQLKNSRRWLTTARGLKLNINGKLITPPMYSHIYEISTEKESNSKGTWYSYNISNPTILQNEQKHLYELGKSFNKESMTDLANLIPQKPNTEESLTQSTDTSVVDNTDAF